MGEKSKLTIRKDGVVVAVLTGNSLEVVDINSLEGSVVYQLVMLGVPVSREDPNVRYEFWRIQVSDPDFTQAVTKYIEQFGLTAEQA